MRLIADSGSTKTDWCLLHDGQVVTRQQTQGINPFHQGEDDMRLILQEELYPRLVSHLLSCPVLEICFYGAGCLADKSVLLGSLLEEWYRCHFRGELLVSVYDDLTGAARALCGRKAGIAAILGTGANSCYYDGEAIVENVPALGYILGDEGSGAVLGKLFVNAIFKGDLPARLRDLYLEETGQTLPAIIDCVYCQPLANRYLAGVSLFVGKHLADCPELRQLVTDNFRDFFRKNVEKYKRPGLKVSAVGSIAYHYAGQLREAAALEGFEVGKILKSPMEGLIAYHSQPSAS